MNDDGPIAGTHDRTGAAGNVIPYSGGPRGDVLAAPQMGNAAAKHSGRLGLGVAVLVVLGLVPVVTGSNAAVIAALAAALASARPRCRMWRTD